MSLQTSKRDHLEKVKIYFRKFSNSLQAKIQWEKLGTLTPQHGQHLGKSSETIFFLMSNLKPHPIREIQKNPNWYLGYWNVKSGKSPS